MPLALAQLDATLQRGLSPLYLFGGPEPLLLQECRDKVFALARAEGVEERQLLDAGRDFDWDRLGEAGGTLSLFSQRRIVDLRLPTGKPGVAGAKALSAWAESPDPDTLLVITCEAWDASSRKAKWAQRLDQAGTRVDIWSIGPEEMPRWISERMSAAGLVPEREAVLVLADRLQSNLLAAQQEIDKLLLLRGPGPVSEADVLSVVSDAARFDGFLLSDRILEGNLEDALRVALGLRRTGIPIQLVSGALVRGLRSIEQYRQAMSAGENENQVFRRLQVWRSRQQSLRGAARRIGGSRLADAWYRLAEIDRQSKGRAPGDPWHSLDSYVRALCA